MMPFPPSRTLLMTVELEASPVGTDELADWLELYTLKSSEKGLSTQRLMAETEKQLNFEENKFALALNTLKKRANLIENYPFKVDDISIILKENIEMSAYLTLLFLSRPAVLMNWQTNMPTTEELDAFEIIVCDSLCSYFGPGTQATTFGWPSKSGRPENFDAAVKWLANKIGLQPGSMFRPPRRKDGGVDVVVWRHFPDNRSGFLIGLVQCTLQQNYVAKSRDIDLRLWSRWLEMDRDPITILAIPNAVPNGEHWQEATANSIVFERVRLSQNHSNILNDELQKFNKKTLSFLKTYDA
jgi:hypothetical protein